MSKPLTTIPRNVHKDGYNQIVVDFEEHGQIKVKILSGKESVLPVTRKHLEQVQRAIKSVHKTYEKAIRLEAKKAERLKNKSLTMKEGT